MIYIEMNHRFNLAMTKRRFSMRVLEQKNRISPRIDYVAPSDDAFKFEAEFVLAKMKNMTPEEAAAFSAQAVAEAEVALKEAADAMLEAEAAAAEAEAAAAGYRKMSKKMKLRM